MDLEGIMLSSERERNVLHVFTYMWNKKQNKKTNITKQNQTHRYKEQTGSFQSVGMSEKVEGDEGV